jgi:hypothetical protein
MRKLLLEEVVLADSMMVLEIHSRIFSMLVLAVE